MLGYYMELRKGADKVHVLDNNSTGRGADINFALVITITVKGIIISIVSTILEIIWVTVIVPRTVFMYSLFVSTYNVMD